MRRGVPARTSKTLRNLRKLLALHFRHEGFMSCIVRTNSVDLDDTIRYDLRTTLLKYQLDDPRSPIQQSGGPTRFHTLRINGGEMRLGGMNRPGRILGTESRCDYAVGIVAVHRRTISDAENSVLVVVPVTGVMPNGACDVPDNLRHQPRCSRLLDVSARR